jgi:hypothetical protein
MHMHCHLLFAQDLSVCAPAVSRLISEVSVRHGRVRIQYGGERLAYSNGNFNV